MLLQLTLHRRALLRRPRRHSAAEERRSAGEERMKTYVAAMLTACLLVASGCLTTMRCPRQDLYFHRSPDQLRQALFSALQARYPDCVLSETPDGLSIHFPSYPGRKGGLFGLGPTYEETLQVNIILSATTTNYTMVSTTRAVEERQNSRFPWRAIEVSERADERVVPLLRYLQQMRSHNEP